MNRRGRLIIAFGLLVLVAASCRYTTHLRLPDEQAVSSRILWGDGTLLTRVHGVEDRDPVKLADMAPVLPRAVIAIEDAHYYDHGGVELRGVVRAVTHNLEQGRAAEGGSTITQQYVRAVLLGNEKSLKRKLHEAVMAIQIEDRYSKHTILERYLNTVYFGNGAYGVEAASRVYFGKDAAALDLGQATLLAGLIRSPTDYNPYVQPEAATARRNDVVERMRILHRITEPEAAFVRALPLGVIPLTQDERYPAPFFVEKVKKFIFNDPRFGATTVDRERALFNGGLTIETTLDPSWQLEAETALHGILTDPTDPPGAIVAIDPRDGHVRAYASSQDFFTTDPNSRFFNFAHDDFANARGADGQPTRSPGSTFKPFVLTAALQAGIPLTKTYDAPASITIPLPGQDPWTLSNFETGRGYGRINLTDATVNSVNTVYGQLVMDVGAPKVAFQAAAMGITTKLETDKPSIAIGSQPATVYDMASAYGVLAADGVRHPAVYVTRVTNRSGEVLYEAHPTQTQVVPPNIARTVTGVLQQVVQRGTGVNARIGRPVAGKTGTAEDFSDAWFVGYTPELVAAVWVGEPEGNGIPMVPPRTRIQVIGGTFPARIWQIFASSALANVPNGNFPEPDTATSSTSSTSTTTKVPIGPGLVNVVGISAIDAIQSLSQKGYRVEIVNAPSRRYPPGYVIAQDPAAGAPVRPGATITLTVATGRPRVLTVPNVLGLLADQAAAAIRSGGFVANVIVQSEPPPTSIESSGKAWKQSPISGSAADEGSTINVWVNP